MDEDLNKFEIKPCLGWNYPDEDGNLSGEVGFAKNNDALPLLNNLPVGNGFLMPKNLSDYYGFSTISNQSSGILNNDGGGQTIAIIDAYGNPNVQSDLDAFCAYVGIPSTQVQVYYPYGAPTSYDDQWALETNLDVQYAHAMALSAKIALIVSPNNTNFNTTYGCMNYAINTLSANVLSMSFIFRGYDAVAGSYPDTVFENLSAHYVAGAGDWWSESSWPASSPYVLGVGGSYLYGGDSNNYSAYIGSYNEQNAWGNTGGGMSVVNTRPYYQNVASSYTGRGVPDVGYNAGSGVGVYITYPVAGSSGWASVMGTSAGTPQWAALLARMNSAGVGYQKKQLIHKTLYTLASSNYSHYFNDVIYGSNSNPFLGITGYSAGIGYDLLNGLGSPKVASFLPVLTSHSITPSPTPSQKNTDIMYNINSYSISDLYWNPVSFNPIGEKYNLNKNYYVFDNGMSFNVYDALSGLNDLSFNNKNGIFLTGLQQNTDIVSDKSQPEIVNTLSVIETPIVSNDGYVLNINSSFALSKTNRTTFDIDDKFDFTFENSKVSVKHTPSNSLSANSFFLTYVNNQLKFAPAVTPLGNSQLFEYTLGERYIALFLNGTNYTYPLKVDTDLVPTYFDPTQQSLPSTCLLYLPSFNNKERDYSSVSDSFLVSYDASPLIRQSELSVSKKDSNYSQNYLGIFPNENYTLDANGNAVFDLYFHALKNYQTTEYHYNSNGVNRTYDKIYSGTNQSKGLDKIYLGYQTNTVKLEFKPSVLNKFFYSPTSETVNLNDAGFITDGATAGSLPIISDRFYTGANGILGQTTNVNIDSSNQSGNSFLCSWLSNVGGSLKWMDRYYNSAFYSNDQALSATSLVYNDKLDPNKPYVYDTPTNARLDAGVLYHYYHVGKEDSINFLPYLNYNSLTKKYSNILTITNWTSSKLDDMSTYNNNGLVYNNNPLNYNGNYLNFDGTNYGIFPATDSLLENKKISVGIWLNVNDWSNIKGYQIFGNYYNSGFGLTCDTNKFCPVLTIVNNATNKIYNLNYRFGNISSKAIMDSDSNSAFSIIQRLPDYSYWVFDTFNFKGVYYSPDDVVLKDIKIPKVIDKIDQIEFNSVGVMYFYDNSLKTYISLNSLGTYLGLVKVNFKTQRIEIDINDKVLEIYGNASVVDNDNNIWEMIGSNLYKNRNIYATIGAARQMTCDNYNNLWILLSNDTYTKIDSNGNILFNYSFNNNVVSVTNCPLPPPIIKPNEYATTEDIPVLSDNLENSIFADNEYEIVVDPVLTNTIYPKNPSNVKIRNINFINSAIESYNKKCSSSSQNSDQMIMVNETDGEAYIFDQYGTPLIGINFTGLVDKNESLNFHAKGDFTGYQYVRKYKNSNKKLSWKFKVADKDGNNSILHSLPYDVSNLVSGWHHFGFSFDSVNGIAKCFVDSIPVASSNFTKNYVLQYDYRTSLLLGTTTVKNNILNKFLNTNDGYNFVGKVADLRVYNIYLDEPEFQQLYKASEFSPNSTSLNWNMKVGSRNYVEEITHWFKFQLKGNKSKYYNINIHNLDVSDSIKSNVETALRNVISKTAPAYAELHKINWI